jgi:hypothetical protein
MEGSQEARDYFSRPVSERGDPSRLLGTKQGQAAYKALNEGQIKQLEATQKRVNLIGAGAGAVLENPTVENFRNVVENLVKNQVYSREDADKAIATIGNDPSKIPSFVTPLYRQAISAEKDLSDKTSRANAATAAGPGHRQASVAEQRLAQEKQEMDLIRGVLTGGGTAPAAAPMTGGSASVAGAQAPTQPNALAPQAAPAPNVNALAGGGDAQQQIAAIDAKINMLMGAGPKATPIVQALIAQKNSILNAEAANYGDVREVELVDPNTNRRYMGLARLDKRTNQYVPISVAEPPILVGGTSPTSASTNVAKPKPSAQTEKERIATQQLPESISTARDAIQKIDQMIGPSNKDLKDKSGKIIGVNPEAHPGFKGAVGAGYGARFIPGTDANAFEARHKEILGQAFLDAFESLKGGGHITEIEGKKATEARTRMNLALKETEYIEAAREFQDVVRRGIERAEQHMTQSSPTSATTSAPAATGNVIDFGSLK